MAQDAETPAQQRARDYFKPGGQYEKDNLGIRERLHDAEIDAEPRRRCGGERGANFHPGGPLLSAIPTILIADRRPSQRCGAICFRERRGRACLAARPTRGPSPSAAPSGQGTNDIAVGVTS
jgi:hypothetical protein